ncbi:MAG: YdeI/OmpD-associated family protein [Melioribacteraceae bacterium]
MVKINSIEEYIIKYPEWEKSFNLLYEITMKIGLTAAIKWGVPVFSYNNKNVAGFAVFKNYSAIWFYQGALLNDKFKKLINAQEDKTKALRQWRFKTPDEIIENKKIIVEYLTESINNLNQGKVIKKEKSKELVIPEELNNIFRKNKKLYNAFQDLSLSCKREYIDYIAEAKKQETKLKRIEKIIPMILNKEDLYRKYKTKK